MYQDGVEAAQAAALLAEQDVGPGGQADSNEEEELQEICTTLRKVIVRAEKCHT